MKRPHRHHIVREYAPSNWSDENRKFILESQQILSEHNIDLNKSIHNFTWAPNGERMHSVEAAKIVGDALVKANTSAENRVDAKAKVLNALKALGDMMQVPKVFMGGTK